MLTRKRKAAVALKENEGDTQDADTVDAPLGLFDALPDDVVLKIIDKVPLKWRLDVRCVCRKFCTLCSDSHVQYKWENHIAVQAKDTKIHRDEVNVLRNVLQKFRIMIYSEIESVVYKVGNRFCQTLPSSGSIWLANKFAQCISSQNNLNRQ